MPSNQNAQKHILFVINPISGDIDKQDLDAKIEAFAAKHQLQVAFFNTTGENDDEHLKAFIAEKKPDIVGAVGGDGTVNLVAKQLVHTKTPLAIIPMGSGNGLSKDLQIPQNDIAAALEVLLQYDMVNLDTLEVDGQFFMHLADIGFNARIVKLFNNSNKRGLLSYLRFTIREFFKYKTTRYVIKTDNGNFSGSAFMITIANSNQFGSNLTINPDGKYDDGLFEVIVIKRFPRKKALGLFFRMLFKRINFSPYCKIIQCRQAEIFSMRRQTLQFDGEIAGTVKSFKIIINPGSLKVLAPLDSQAG